MMFNPYYDDWMKLELDTAVLAVREAAGKYWHAFEETVFYPEGGGMDRDTGTINDHEVLDLKLEDDKVWHLLDEKLQGRVHMRVDKDQRVMKCQVHSASHLMCGIMNKVYHADTISFYMNEHDSGAEMGFETFNDEIMKELERLCNDYILQDLPIEIIYPTPEEAQQHVLDEKLNHEDLRAVIIGDIDYNMCGCIHVPSLRYLQSFKFLNYEKTTRGYKINFVCGEQLLQTYGKQIKVLADSAKSLGVPQLNLKAGIDKLQSELKASKNEANSWKQQVIELKAKIMHEEAEAPCLFHEFDDMDIKTFQGFCSYFVRNYEHGIFFLCKVEDRCHVMISHSKSFAYPCGELFKKLSAEYGLRGGGNPSMAQGGGEYSEALINALKALCDEQNQSAAS